MGSDVGRQLPRGPNHNSFEEKRDANQKEIEQRKEVACSELFAFSWQKRRDRDAGDEGGKAAFGAQRQESDESQTGDCDWTFEG